MRVILFAAAAALISMPALAAADETAAPVQTDAAKPAKPKKICRKAEASSTSRIGVARVCKTAEEWAAADGNGASTSGSRSVKSYSGD